MDDQTRREAATTAVGLTGVGSAAALRHHGLERAYGKNKRPPVLQELKMMRRGAKGRRIYGAGMVLGAVSTPAAVIGIDQLARPNTKVDKAEKVKRRSFVGEGVDGARQSFLDSNQTLKNPPPTHLMLGNYAAGGIIGAASGGTVHRVLGKTRLSGGKRSAAASMVATTTGAATLPIQSKIMRKVSHGRYESTATGMHRIKANKLPKTKDAVTKADTSYYGHDMSHAQKRRRVAAVTGPPILGDLAQAAQAARMAPPHLRKKTAVAEYGGAQAGGGAGTAAGAYGAAALASRSKTFEAGAGKVGDFIDGSKAKARSAVGVGPKAEGPSRASKLVPGSVKTAVKPLLKPLVGHGKVAAVGGLVGGTVGGVTGSQSGYGYALHLEDKYKAKVAASSQSARHGSRKARPGDVAKLLNDREKKKLARQKEQSAVLSQAGGVTGLSALGATVGSKMPGVKPTVKAHLAKVPVGLLTVGAGLGGVNAFKYANIQHLEAAAKAKDVAKALLGAASKAPSVRRAGVRTIRTRTGTRTMTVRGSLR